MKFYLDFHRVHMAMATNADQRKGRQVFVPVISADSAYFLSDAVLSQASSRDNVTNGGELVVPAALT